MHLGDVGYGQAYSWLAEADPRRECPFPEWSDDCG